jgi:carboxymethylenebutenolidase
MAHFGERDAAIPVAGARQLAAAHPEAQFFFYDAEHGFNCDQRKSYNAAAAKLARERSLAFLRQHVG